MQAQAQVGVNRRCPPRRRDAPDEAPLALLRGALLEAPRAHHNAQQVRRSPPVPMNANAGPYAATGDTLWSSVIDSLRGRLSARRLDEIRSATVSSERNSSCLRVLIDAAAARSWTHDGRLSLLDAAVTDRTDGGLELALIPSEKSPRVADPVRSLDRFLHGPANREPLARARELAAARAPGPFPVVFFGPPGSGKTHLVCGIAQRLRETERTVLLTGAEPISLELVAALRANDLQVFRDPLIRCETLLIDDVHALVEREGTQDELTRILLERAHSSSPTVISSRLAPQECTDLRPELREALAAGRGEPLRAPDWETRVAVILEHIALWGIEAQANVASLLARSLGASLARLDAVLTRLMTHPACASGLVDPELVRRVLENGGPLVASARPQQVIGLISRHFSVRPSELRSSARSPRITTPRQLAMYLLRHHCGLSYPEIGQRFRRHHTTAMHACRRIEQQRDQSSSLHATVTILEKELLRLSENGG